MKKIFFLILIALPQILVGQNYQTEVIFIQEGDFVNQDTFYFELSMVKSCEGITDKDIKELPYTKTPLVNEIWYNSDGVTSYIDYFGDFHCWAYILFDKKRLYLSE